MRDRLVSLREAARILGADRSVLARIVKQRSIQAARRSGAHHKYSLRTLRDALETRDPAQFSEYERRADVQADWLKLRWMKLCATLITRADHERERARILEILGRGLDELPASIARELELPPAALDRLGRHIAEARAGLTPTDSPTKDGDDDHA